jgi:hypothetical protein
MPRSIPPDAALRAVARVIAIRVGRDPEVDRFRREILQGRLVREAPGWIERTARRPEALAASVEEGRPLYYRDDATIPVRTDRPHGALPRSARALSWLAEITDRLARAWGLQPAEVVAAVLTGEPPNLSKATATIAFRTPTALSEITLRVRPSMAPEELTNFYAGVRAFARGPSLPPLKDGRPRTVRPKPVDAWKADLVVHVEENNDGQTTWEEAMTKWDRGHPEKRFAVTARFRRVATEAVQRVLGEELAWKNPTGAPGQRRHRRRKA